MNLVDRYLLIWYGRNWLRIGRNLLFTQYRIHYLHGSKRRDSREDSTQVQTQFYSIHGHVVNWLNCKVFFYHALYLKEYEL